MTPIPDPNLTGDVQDLYVERVNPLNENQYEVDSQWRDMEIIEEWIHIKPELPEFLNDAIPPVKWHVRRTKHGPVISDALGGEDVIALSWTSLANTDKSFDSMRRVNYARNWDEFKGAFTEYVGPGLNYHYADKNGNIASLAVGKIPVRNKGDGRLPVPGWLSEYDWVGYIPIDEMPFELNPSSGLIINANNQIHGPDYPYIVSNNWSPPYRAQRISQVLSEFINLSKKISTHDMLKMQGDKLSLQAKELNSFLNTLKPEKKEQKRALDKMVNWDFVLDEDSEAAALFQVWIRNFYKRILKDDLRGTLLFAERGNALQSVLNDIQPIFVSKLVKNQDQTIKYNWCDQSFTNNIENCEELALLALDDALTEIKKYSGANAQWGDLYQAYFPHSIFSRVQMLDSIFNRSITSGGDAYSINVAKWTYSKDKGYRQSVGPSYRQIIDLSNWDNSGFILNTGQSGNVLSKHYDDQLEPHRDVQLLTMNFGFNEVKTSKYKSFSLEPKSDRPD